MGDDEKSSFRGSLARFAYAPQTSLSSSLQSSHYQRAAAQAPCSIKEEDHRRSSTSSAPPVALSRKREGDSVRRSRKRRSTKLGNDHATALLSGIPDCVAEELDGQSCFISILIDFFFLLNAKPQCSFAESSVFAADLDAVRALTMPYYCSPGHMSAVTGHHYANPTNHFWHCLHLSGTFLIHAVPFYYCQHQRDDRLYTETIAPLGRCYTSSAFQSRTCAYLSRPSHVHVFFSSFHSKHSYDLTPTTAPAIADQPRRSSINLAS